MKTQTYPALLCTLALLASGLSLAAYEPAAYQVADPISYTGWNTGPTPMNAFWPYAGGNAPAISTSGNDIRFTLNNGITGTPLAHPLTSGFDLTVDALHTSYSRLLWVGLFNDTGTQGYGLAWDSSLSGINGGMGVVSIRKFSSTGTPTYSNQGSLLGSATNSGHVATAFPMARLRLTWDRDNSTLKLYVDGVLKQTVVDSSFTSFSRLYASGYTGSIFDNVAVAMPVGANVPFVTHEAEDAVDTLSGGTIVAMTSSPNTSTITPEQEASGRAYVQLNDTGDSLSVTATKVANAIVLRHCIPDATNGGGTTATLSLYVNGTKRQSLSLSSKYNWLYTSTASANGQSNSPGSGIPHVFWDETAYRINETALQPGDVIALKKDSDDNAAYYRIDLLDLENVPDALPPPSSGTYLSVTDFGASGADSIDDSQAIINCIAAAKTAGKTVWIPAGTYYQSQRFTLDGVTVQGAGMWYTNIIGKTPVTDWAGNLGFSLSGTGSRVSNLRIASEVITSRDDKGAKPFTGAGTDWEVDHVWITHTITGFWMSTAKRGYIHDCRVRFTYADAINLNQGTTNTISEHNHVRGCGDDGIAILAETDRGNPASANNTHRNNTVIANWWGHNADLAGGDNNVMCNNYIADNALMGGFTINSPWSYPMHALNNSVVSGNLVVRGGGPVNGQSRGAMWFYTTSGTIDATVRDNLVIDAVFKGIQLSGGTTQQIAFSRNIVDDPGTDGIVIDSVVKGSGTFTDNTVQNLNAGRQPFINNASSNDYTATQTGNSWQ
jgi:hypothetical protein